MQQYIKEFQSKSRAVRASRADAPAKRLIWAAGSRSGVAYLPKLQLQT